MIHNLLENYLFILKPQNGPGSFDMKAIRIFFLALFFGVEMTGDIALGAAIIEPVSTHFSNAAEFEEKFLVNDLVRYASDKNHHIEVGINSVIMKYEGIKVRTGTSYVSVSKRVATGSHLKGAFGCDSPSTKKTSALALAGLIICDGPNPSIGPKYGGTYVLFCLNAVRQRVELYRVEGGSMKEIGHSQSESLTNTLLSIRCKSDILECFAGDEKIGTTESIISNAFFGFFFLSDLESFSARVDDFKAENTAVAALALPGKLAPMVIANYIPWHPRDSFIDDVQKPGRDIPLTYLSGNHDRIREYSECFKQMALLGFDVAMVDIAVVKWWQTQMPIFDDMLLAVARNNIPIKLMVQIDTAVHTKPSVENVYPAVEYWFIHFGSNKNFLHIGDKPVIATFDADALSPSDWSEIFRRLKTKGFEAVWIAEFNQFMKEYRSEFAPLNDKLPRYIRAEGDFENYLRVFDGVYSFACHPTLIQYQRMIKDWQTRMPEDNKMIMGTVYPGYYSAMPSSRSLESNPRNGTSLARQTWEFLIKRKIPWYCYSTWNEYNENTMLEPTLHNGGVFADLARIYIGKIKNSPQQNLKRTVYLSYKGEAVPGKPMDFEVLNIPSDSPNCHYTLTIYDANKNRLWSVEGNTTPGNIQADRFTFVVPPSTPASTILRPEILLSDKIETRAYTNLGNIVVLPSIASDLTRHVNLSGTEFIERCVPSLAVNLNERTFTLSLTAQARKNIRTVYLFKNGALTSIPDFSRKPYSSELLVRMTWPAISPKNIRDGELILEGGEILSSKAISFDDRDEMLQSFSNKLSWKSRGSEKAELVKGINVLCATTRRPSFAAKVGDRSIRFGVGDLPLRLKLEDETRSEVFLSAKPEDVYDINISLADQAFSIPPQIDRREINYSLSRPLREPYLGGNFTYFYFVVVSEDNEIFISDSSCLLR